ncbi:hypothetical protein INR49_031155 [Caranx melampygus]|nr:hypothetical protein INR49_031155 [Caranx melampygus]
MQDLVVTLLDVLLMLSNIFMLYVFLLVISAIVGVQLWKGELRNHCFLGADIPYVSLSPYFVPVNGKGGAFICSPNNWGMRHCQDVLPYVQDGKTCSAAPNHGLAANACVNWNMYYNTVTLEGWTDIMFLVMDAHFFGSMTVFILVTTMGYFIIMNVCAVVIATQFSKSLTRQKQPGAPGEQQEWQRNCTALTHSLIPPVSQGEVFRLVVRGIKIDSRIVVGRILFGGKFNFQTQDGQTINSSMNFDSLHWSMVTVLQSIQVLTEEDWNLVLYDAKHIFLNIMVGIMVRGFQTESTHSAVRVRNSWVRQKTEAVSAVHCLASSLMLRSWQLRLLLARSAARQKSLNERATSARPATASAFLRSHLSQPENQRQMPASSTRVRKLSARE